MKKRIWRAIALGMQCTLAALAMTTIVACDKEDEDIDPGYTIDFTPVIIEIEPVDELGNNLMAQMKDWKITAEWRGCVYERDSLDFGIEPTTRYNVPIFRGIHTNPDSTRLYFGGLYGDHTYKDEQIILNWGNEDCDTIVFSHELKKKGKWDYYSVEEITLNGVRQESFNLKIVK